MTARPPPVCAKDVRHAERQRRRAARAVEQGLSRRRPRASAAMSCAVDRKAPARDRRHRGRRAWLPTTPAGELTAK